jgi:hypothetical protein
MRITHNFPICIGLTIQGYRGPEDFACGLTRWQVLLDGLPHPFRGVIEAQRYCARLLSAEYA